MAALESVLQSDPEVAEGLLLLMSECDGLGEFGARVPRSALNMLMSAEADAARGAVLGEHSGARANGRNGHRGRSLKTAAGDLEFEIPKPRRGTYPRFDPHPLVARGAWGPRGTDAAYVGRRVAGRPASRAVVAAIALGEDGQQRPGEGQPRDQAAPPLGAVLSLQGVAAQARQGRDARGGMPGSASGSSPGVRRPGLGVPPGLGPGRRAGARHRGRPADRRVNRVRDR